MELLRIASLIYLLLAVSAHADMLDNGWAACQTQREVKVVGGRSVMGDFKPEVREDCNKIKEKIFARKPPGIPSQKEVDDAERAFIKRAVTGE